MVPTVVRAIRRGGSLFSPGAGPGETATTQGMRVDTVSAAVGLRPAPILCAAPAIEISATPPGHETDTSTRVGGGESSAAVGNARCATPRRISSSVEKVY